MNSRGITWVELITTVAIVGILGVSLGFAYTGWLASYSVEKQIKELYADLMTARVMAMERSRTYFLDFTDSRSYRIVEDSNGNCQLNAGAEDRVLPSFPKTVDYGHRANGTGIPLTVRFNSRGLMTPLRTIWIAHEASPDYDCIVISTTRINMGRMSGGACLQK